MPLKICWHASSVFSSYVGSPHPPPGGSPISENYVFPDTKCCDTNDKSAFSCWCRDRIVGVGSLEIGAASIFSIFIVRDAFERASELAHAMFLHVGGWNRMDSIGCAGVEIALQP